jgi:hypothetical protein
MQMKSGAMSRPGAGTPWRPAVPCFYSGGRRAVRWNREMPLLRSTATEGAEQNDLHRE